MPGIVITEKKCSRCKLTKPIEEFYPRRYNQSVGYMSTCKLCGIEIAREHRAKKRKTRPLKEPVWKSKEDISRYMHAYSIHRKYGITGEEYEAMLKQQDGLCAICKRPSDKRLCVDHDHETDIVRGLTCVTCNLLIGFIERDLGLVGEALKYLKAFEGQDLTRK